MTNLPVKGSAERVVGAVYDGQISIENSNGFRIVYVYFNPAYLEGLADTIATLITDARDTGFAQGQKHVRDALGIR